MDKSIVERRRILRLFAFGAVAIPVAALVGCSEGSGGSRPPQFYGGSNHDEKSHDGGARR